MASKWMQLFSHYTIVLFFKVFEQLKFEVKPSRTNFIQLTAHKTM